MAISNFSALGKAIHDNGKYHYQYFYKAATPAPGAAGYFVDCGQSSGIPKYNAYAGSSLTRTPLVGAGNGGVYTGPSISGHTKYLLKLQANINGTNSVPTYLYLCDYVAFYPLIDCDDVDPQVMDNTEPLPRYTDGEGLRPVFIATAPMTFSAPCTITYTNSSGVSGRTTTFNLVPGTNIGVCATASGAGAAVNNITPFFPLAGNDTGVRSIEQVQLSAGMGGFAVLALVRPLATLSLMEIDVTCEKMFGVETQGLPEIKDGAYLNFLLHRGAGTTQTAFLSGEMVFVNI